MSCVPRVTGVSGLSIRIPLSLFMIFMQSVSINDNVFSLILTRNDVLFIV